MSGAWEMRCAICGAFLPATYSNLERHEITCSKCGTVQS